MTNASISSRVLPLVSTKHIHTKINTNTLKPENKRKVPETPSAINKFGN